MEPPSGPPADPIGRLFSSIGDPSAHHQNTDYGARNAVFVDALRDYVGSMLLSTSTLTVLAKLYLVAAEKALAHPDHAADHFIEALAGAEKRFPLGALPSMGHDIGELQEIAGDGRENNHPGLLSLEARWHRFAVWTAQGRRDMQKDEALTSNWETAAGKAKIYEDELEEYATIQLTPACSTTCAFCGKENPDHCCYQCGIWDGAAHVETVYCNEGCRIMHRYDHQDICQAQTALYRSTTVIYDILQNLFSETYYRPTSMVRGNRQGVRILSYPFQGDRWTRAVSAASITGIVDIVGNNPLRPSLDIDPILGTRDHRNRKLGLSRILEQRREEINRVINDPRAFVGGLVIGQFPTQAVRTRREKTLSKSPPASDPIPPRVYPDVPATLEMMFLNDEFLSIRERHAGVTALGISKLERPEIRSQIQERNAHSRATEAQRSIYRMDGTAAMLYGESKQALILAMPLFRELLIPLCAKMEMVTVSPKNARVAVTWRGRQATPIHIRDDDDEVIARSTDTVRNNMFFDHHVLRVTLKTGERFAIDFTGGQYGWKEYLCLWEPYHSRRVHHIKSVRDLPLHMDYGPSVSKTREELAHALRWQVMGSVMSAIKDNIPPVNSTPAPSDANFNLAASSFNKLVHRAILLAKQRLKQQGLHRLYLDDEGRVQVTATVEQAAKYRDVWLTGEEVRHGASHQHGPMLRLWKRKLGDRRPSTPPFAPAPPFAARPLAELFGWDEEFIWPHSERMRSTPAGGVGGNVVDLANDLRFLFSE